MAAAIWLVLIRDMPATFVHIVEASSAAAAPPAKALPRPLPEFSCSANAAENAGPAASANVTPATATAIVVGRNGVVIAGLLVLAVRDAASRGSTSIRYLCGEPPR